MSASFSHGSRGRLTARDLGRFPANTLFDRLGRAICRAECLPRKELYEAWEVARRARRLFRGGRVVDLGAGHGLLAFIMVILDDTSTRAVAVDKAKPACFTRVHDALIETWPRLAGRVSFVEAQLDRFPLDAADVIVSSHACGRLTDLVLDRAAAARAPVAVLPCCHDARACDAGGLTGWIDAALAIDVTRAVALRQRGYRVRTQTISSEVTPKNRLLLGEPLSD